MSGPSGTPAPTGCVYLGAPVFGKPPIWTQQSRCTITDRRVSARCVGAAAGMGVQAIRCGTFLYRGWNRTREIQKPLVFGGVLFHISFAVERNMAAGGIEKKVVGPLRPKVTRARGRGTFPAGGMQGKSRQVAAGKSDPRSEARNIPFGKRIAGRRGRRPCEGREDIHSVKDTLCAIGTEGVFYLYLCRAVGQRWPLS